MSGGDLFPRVVATEVILTSPMSQVGGVLESGVSAMGAVPASASAPSGDVFSAFLPCLGMVILLKF